MSKLHLPLIVTLTLLAAGCAQPGRRDSRLSAEAARFGVSRELLVDATSAGYRPEKHHGQTFFCTEQAASFSYIPRSQCLDTAQMTSRLHDSQAGVTALHQLVSSRPDVPPGATAP